MDNEKYYRERVRTPRIFVGLILLGVGGLLIAREMGAYVPTWALSWEMIPIAVGILIGIKHRFNGIGWLMPILVGLFFLVSDFFPEMNLYRYTWPIGVICVGLFFIFKDKRRTTDVNRYWKEHKKFDYSSPSVPVNGDMIDENAIFASTRKNVISKNFLGGDVNAVFGSSEINLLKAEIETVARMDVSAVFGSVRLLVPPHWQIKLENNSVFGGVEDKRPENLVASDKILVLEANAVFGGIEITSF
jgi:predicted membrane protein